MLVIGTENFDDNLVFTLLGGQEFNIVHVLLPHNSHKKVIKYTAKLTFYQKIIKLKEYFPRSFIQKNPPEFRKITTKNLASLLGSWIS